MAFFLFGDFCPLTVYEHLNGGFQLTAGIFWRLFVNALYKDQGSLLIGRIDVRVVIAPAARGC